MQELGDDPVVSIPWVESVLHSIDETSDLERFRGLTRIFIHCRGDGCPLVCFFEKIFKNLHLVLFVSLEDKQQVVNLIVRHRGQNQV